MPARLRVMSFNIRYGTADDGENRWANRRDLVARAIRRFDPDLLGTQEGLDFQLDYLRTELSGYTFVGAGRDDGQQRGEHVAIFFRSDRFTLIREGHFWLSETPQVPGSRGWDSHSPRMVTWCELRDPNAEEDSIVFLNTHFDFRGKVARQESAKLIWRHIESLSVDCRIVLTGDFNCSEDEAPYRTLLFGSSEDDRDPRLVDAYRAVHTTRSSDELTRHDFGTTRKGARIDWVLHSPHFQTEAAVIIEDQFEGRYPSDHYPVAATVRYSQQQPPG